MDLWRLAEFVSVEDAAILIAGGDPSAEDTQSVLIESFRTEEIQVKRTDGHKGFRAVLTALSAAINRGTLPAKRAYPSRDERKASFSNLDPSSQAYHDEAADLMSGEVRPPRDPDSSYPIDEDGQPIKQPDWARTTIAVDDLKKWLQSRGFTDCFFFPKNEGSSGDDFMDPDHDHFAPELAAAVAAWRALSKEQTLKIPPKKAVEKWLDEHPEAWKPKGKRAGKPLSAQAKERISIVVNWRADGGASKSGGADEGDLD